MNSIELIHATFQHYLIETFDLTVTDLHPCTFTLNTDEGRQQFGDISSNTPLVLARTLKRKPAEIAKQIANEFKHELLEKIEVAGPGFLNLFLTPAAFDAIARQLHQEGNLFFRPSTERPRHHFSVEFVSANPTGPLHFGHGRGGIIGDVLGNVLKFIGHEVTKEFYINDAGAQIARLGTSFKIRCQQQLGIDVALPEDGYQGEYLVDFARDCVARYGGIILEKSDDFFQDYAKNHMLERIKQTLNNYGIHFDIWFSEKSLHDDGSITKTLNELEQNGYLYEKDDALWFKSTAFGDDKDRVVRKASGELTYVAADIAYMRNKVMRGADRLVMVLGHDHHGYVNRLQGVHQALGLGAAPLEVIVYQLVKLKEGGQQLRMSKRAGTMVTLSDIIEEVGTDVARFFYLNRKADAQLEFDLALALTKTEENPVYYIQYAYVRTKSILLKAKDVDGLDSINTDDANHMTQTEQLLLKKVVSLKDILHTIATTNQTHLLAYYALELAQTFSRYYTKSRVIDTNEMARSRARLLLVTLVRDSLATTLDLLGLSKPERM